MKKYNQYEIVIVNLDPTLGSEIKKTRPCVIISPNEMNHNINTLIIAPITSTSKEYPTRIFLEEEKDVSGYIVLDQIRTIDKKRITKRVGKLKKETIREIKRILKEMLVD